MKVSNAALVKTIHKFLRTEEKEILKELLDGYKRLVGEAINIEQKIAWKEAIPKLRKVLSRLDDNIVIALEYRLPFSNERVDVILLGPVC